MTVRFATRREDFPPNLDELLIQQVVLYFARSAEVQMEISVGHLQFRAAGSNSPLGGTAVSLDGVISTRKGNAASWASIIGSNPGGDWELALSNDAQTRALFENEQLSDILLVITYSGRTPTWPG